MPSSISRFRRNEPWLRHRKQIKKVEARMLRRGSQGCALIKTESTGIYGLPILFRREQFYSKYDWISKMYGKVNFFSKRLNRWRWLRDVRWQDKRSWWAKNNLENERRRFRVFRNESSASGNKIAAPFSTTTRRVRSSLMQYTRIQTQTHKHVHTQNIRHATRTTKRQGDSHFFSNDTESLSAAIGLSTSNIQH